MWIRIAQYILHYRKLLLGFLILVTGIMAYYTTKLSMSYDFTSTIPTNNIKYIEYKAFQKLFGDDGNTIVLGIETPDLFTLSTFYTYQQFAQRCKNLHAVEDVLSIPQAVYLLKDSSTERLKTPAIFPNYIPTQTALDSCVRIFNNLPFYAGRLYNAQTHAYLMALKVNKAIFSSPRRVAVVDSLQQIIQTFEKETKLTVYASGLPFIRTRVAEKLAKETRLFLVASLLLSILTLLIFFRSISATLMSVAVVLMGVLWSTGLMGMLGYKVSILTALVPPLIVVIGIPNCIYFLNKYHTSYQHTPQKQQALIAMIDRMGIVTLFCNITAAIGFGVFVLTQSVILKEFGLIASISIISLFFISLIWIPSLLSFMPVPKKHQTKYLHNIFLQKILKRIEYWSMQHKQWVIGVSIVLVVFAVLGVLRLKSNGYIVDDLPKKDKVYTDLKFFEKNFKGIMPVEIVIDSKKKNGITRSLRSFEKIDSLAQYIAIMSEMSTPLSLVDGLKFVRQAYYDGDSASYQLPNSFDMAFLAPYLKAKKDSAAQRNNSFNKILQSFIDSNKQIARLSVNMADVGSSKLPIILNNIQAKTNELFDTTYRVNLTGASVTFLEGTRFIISGLTESIIWAFVLIAICMLYLFKSLRILLCSLIPNIIPLLITAGVMGWVGVPLKPSTVLIFSVALGIAVDITIRFLVNYKQQLPHNNNKVIPTVMETIHHTGISIVYTSLVLIAGFIVFCLSSFGGISALGWLTSLTLLVSTLTNLILLPVLLVGLGKKK